jgi:hypothetical protein
VRETHELEKHLGLPVPCEVSASYEWLENIRVSAKGAVAVIVIALMLNAFSGGS